MLRVQGAADDEGVLADIVYRQGPRAPGEERLVVSQLGDLALQAHERVLRALAVEQRHVHVEKTHEGVGQVLGARGAAVRGPRHALRDAPVALRQPREVRLLQHRPVDPRDLLDRRRVLPLRPDSDPVSAVELDRPGRDELLQRPAPSKPSASRKARVLGHRVVRVRHVTHISEADFGGLVPGVHGVDGLRQLRAARLVDAARVDPNPVEPVLPRQLAAHDNLGVLPFPEAADGPQLMPPRQERLEGRLIAGPCMRQDRVRWPFLIERPQFQRTGVEKSHCVGCLPMVNASLWRSMDAW